MPQLRIPTGTAPFLGIPQPGGPALIFRRTLLERGLHGAEPVSVEISPGDGNGRPDALRVRYRYPGGRGVALFWNQGARLSRYDLMKQVRAWAEAERTKRQRQAVPRPSARQKAITKLERQIAKLENPRWGGAPSAPVNPLIPREPRDGDSDYPRTLEAKLREERPVRRQLAGIAALVFGMRRAALTTMGDSPYGSRLESAQRAGYKALRDAGFKLPTESQMHKHLSVRVNNSGGYWRGLSVVAGLEQRGYWRRPENWPEAMAAHQRARREYADRRNEIASLRSQIEGIGAMEDVCTGSN
jgi:hypothetical protein